ncbi:MAG: acetylglutamate kinase [Clostridiales bacterium]|jgi:acetylglutamate kinase|nr:acetylglutamate kinase [Clostridiales bacterium]
MQVNDRANTLIKALPYIKEYHKKTVVIKYGGNAMISGFLKEAVIRDIVMLSLIGVNVVLIHGGGPEISEMLSKTGKEPKFINGLRYTDSETMDIVQMVLCGKVNKDLVSYISREGGKAVGLCGLDGNMLCAEKISKAGIDYGFVGEIDDVDVSILNDVIEKGYIPVISTVAKNRAGSPMNVNADLAASKIAIALNAEKLILLTDVKGVMGDYKDDNSLISVVKLSEIEGLKSSGVISGGMIPKVDCCYDAVSNNVNRAHIIDGRVLHSILIEMLSDEGVGTMIIKG